MAKKTARNTRGKIVSAAWKLFYEQGYEHTTVEDMQAMVGILKTIVGLYAEHRD